MTVFPYWKMVGLAALRETRLFIRDQIWLGLILVALLERG